eukprot:3297280-Prymnesium_polylepis.1
MVVVRSSSSGSEEASVTMLVPFTTTTTTGPSPTMGAVLGSRSGDAGTCDCLPVLYVITFLVPSWPI